MNDDRTVSHCNSAESRPSTAARDLQYLQAHRGRGPTPPLAYRGAFFLSFALAACGGRAATQPAAPRPTHEIAKTGGPWTATLERSHPLVGRIWSPSEQSFVDRSTFDARAAAAKYVLVGEQHDHPDHHRLQREVIAAMVAKGRAPAVVFEMVDVDDQSKIDGVMSSPNPDAHAQAEAIGEATSWGSRGWTWPFYEPIVEFALEHHLPIVAGNFPRGRIKDSFHGTPIDDETKHALLVDRPLPPALESSLEGELAASHCHQLPQAILPGFALAQRLRDGAMAERMQAHATPSGAVLVAGSGHVRTDRGVPWYLAARDPKGTRLSIAFVEVEAERTQPSAYAERFAAQTLPFDLVFFTPAAQRDDPCGK